EPVMAHKDRRDVGKTEERERGLHMMMPVDNVGARRNVLQPIDDGDPSLLQLGGNTAVMRAEDNRLVPERGQLEREIADHDFRSGAGCEGKIGKKNPHQGYLTSYRYVTGALSRCGEDPGGVRWLYPTFGQKRHYL